MSDTVKTASPEKTRKTSWFKGLKAEFKKIIWPDKASLVKQTTVVLVVAIVLGVIIAMLDMVLQFGIEKLIR